MRRAQQLNVAAGKRKFDTKSVSAVDYEFFVWPLLLGQASTKKITLCNAWRCRKCIRCFTVIRDSNQHVCQSFLRSKCTQDRVVAAQKLLDYDATGDGLHNVNFKALVACAIAALKGQDITPWHGLPHAMLVVVLPVKLVLLHG